MTVCSNARVPLEERCKLLKRCKDVQGSQEGPTLKRGENTPEKSCGSVFPRLAPFSNACLNIKFTPYPVRNVFIPYVCVKANVPSCVLVCGSLMFCVVFLSGLSCNFVANDGRNALHADFSFSLFVK